MSNVILYIAASLDGYIARWDGDISWLTAFQSEQEDYGYAELCQRVSTAIRGANTYRQTLGFGEWPHQGMKTYVVTHQGLPTPPDADVLAYSGDLTDLVRQIKAASERDIWLVGGSQLNAAFLKHDLIDEYMIFVIPVLIGEGIPLFQGDVSLVRNVRLVSTRSYSNGVVGLHYLRHDE